MTRYEIIRMARAAGLSVEAANVGDGIMCGMVPPHGLERFAALVAAAEREACALVCENYDHDDFDRREGAQECAELIRAKGNNEKA